MAKFGLPSKTMEVRLGDFKSPRYQRIIVDARAEKIAKELDGHKFGTLIGSLRDGVIYLLDGQHRHRGAILMGHGDDTVDATIYEGLTETEERKIYEQQVATGRYPLTALELLWGRKQTDDPETLALLETIDRAGFRMNFGRNHRAEHGLQAADTLMRIRDVHGLDHLYEALSLLRDTFPDDPRGWKSDIILGFSRFYSEYGQDDKYERDWFTANIARIGMGEFLDTVRKFRDAPDARRGGKSPHVAQALVFLYNKDCQPASRKLNDWNTQLKRNRQMRAGRK